MKWLEVGSKLVLIIMLVTGYKSSFWTRHKAKKYARSVKRFEKSLKKEL